MPFGPVTLKHQRLKPYRDPPQTLGDHLKKRRIDLGLLQKDVAQQLWVGEWTYLKWEHDKALPAIRMWRRVIEFLGYYPLEPPQRLAERLLAARRSLGLSRKRLAKRFGVDESTLAGWEKGPAQPAGRRLHIVERFLTSRSM